MVFTLEVSFLFKGGITNNAQRCSGLSLFISRDHSLHVLVKSGEQIQVKSLELVFRVKIFLILSTEHTDEELKIPFLCFKKWTNIWLSWSVSQDLRVVVDSIQVSSPIQTSQTFEGDIPNCQNSTFYVGSAEADGEFDLDHLTFFNEILSEEKMDSIFGANIETPVSSMFCKFVILLKV